MPAIVNVPINRIVMGPLFRQEMGNVEILANSIDLLGLLRPIGVDSNMNLVFGQKRLGACRLLAWETIPARVLDIPSLLAESDQELQGVILAFDQPIVSILIVEDDRSLVEIIKGIIDRWVLPVRLVVADNGFDGLIQAGLHKPSVIFTDLMMPDMDGFQMIRKLTCTPDLVVSRLIVMTGLDDQQIAARGGIPDGVEILRKPIHYDRLKEIVLTSTMFLSSFYARSVQ
ncbi:MAG: response regulator [Magnetococcales bacterium]|nr:response regulator [Magnetococcales bacterium]